MSFKTENAIIQIGLLSKDFFYHMCLIFFKELKVDFLNRIWYNLTPFQALDRKQIFYKMLLIFNKKFKIDFKIRNEINQTGNGIISRPLIKNLFLPNLFLKTGNGNTLTGSGIISPISRPLIKNFFYKMCPISIK